MLPEVRDERTANAAMAVAMKQVVKMLRIHQDMGFENVLLVFLGSDMAGKLVLSRWDYGKVRK